VVSFYKELGTDAATCHLSLILKRANFEYFG